MEEEEILLQFFRCVANKTTHKHYARTVAVRKLCRQLVLSEGIDDLLKQYVRREDPDLFEQRKRITNHITPAICGNLLNVFNKIPRSNSSSRVLSYGETGEDRTAVLEKILDEFWGDSSFDDYLNARTIELNGTDANAFIVLQWKQYDGATDRISPYPDEVSSIEAVDYRRENNILQYLTVERDHMYKIDSKVTQSVEDQLLNPWKDKKAGHRYTLYMKNKTYTLTQISETDATATAGVLTQGVPFQTLTEKIIKLADRFFIFDDTKDPHNLDAVPAFQVGYMRDQTTYGETFVSPLHIIEPYLLKTIKVNSEFDLVATLLALPQMVKYGQPCVDAQCFGGEYANGKSCSTCSGTGIKATAPSAQDAIVLPIPRNKDEMLPLGEFIKYIHPDVAIVEWQRAYIEKLTSICKVLLFADDVFDKSQIAETATGKNLDMQSVYDTLWPLAKKMAQVWNFAVPAIADLADLKKGLVSKFTYNKDFKLKSLDTLIADLDRLKDINNPTLKNHIGADIAAIIYAERPMEMMRYRAIEKYSPFSGKSETEIMLLMVSPYVTKRQKILHAQIGLIFDELETENASKNFYLMQRSAQKLAIDKKIDEIEARIDSETPEAEILTV